MAKATIGRRRKQLQRAPGRASTSDVPWPSRRLQAAAIFLTAVCLIGLLSAEIGDTDFWWHLKTGQYITEHHALPVPDPFAYTTSLAPASAAGQQVRHFNLTHEWLSQVLMYGVFRLTGFAGIVLGRAFLLAAFCGLAGFLAARLAASFYAGIAAACAAASVMVAFTADRPGLVSFLGVAVVVTLLELRRGWWAIPPLLLLWANCHGGFILGWLVLLVYAVASLPVWPFRAKDGASPRLWLITVGAIAISGLNPNGFGVVSTVLAYRRSPLTADLIEWHRPSLWGEPYGFDLLLYAAALVLLLSWRKVRPAHWMLFAAFAAASLMAFRNTPLIGFLAPVLIAKYFPFRLRAPRVLAWALPVAALGFAAAGFAPGRFLELRAAAWNLPEGAANFLAEHRIAGPIFNTYEQGGYLIWRLWPGQRVFIDGRALSEGVYQDYNRIVYNAGSYADQVVGPRQELLDRYGVQAVVMNTMDYVSGTLYPLALALANPATTDWQLVYDDLQAVVFVRYPPADVPVLSNKLGRILRHMDRECTADIENSPDTPLCARTLARYWLSNGVTDEARGMLVLYLAHAPRDRQAEQMLRDLDAGKAQPPGRTEGR